MTEKRYDLELLTWTFCGGADQKRAEIRVPSIRGQVRWWFRALGGTWEEERELFGGVLHDSPKRSKVVLRLVEPVVSDNAKNLEDLGLKNDFELGYLLFPLRPSQRSDQRRGLIDPQHGRFTVTATLRGLVKPQLAEMFERAMESWILLGALGTRSRRGFGSVWPQNDSLGGATLRSLEDFRGRLRNLAAASRRHPRVMTLGGGHDTWEKALRAAAKWLKGYRAGSSSFGQKPSRWGRNDHDAALGKANVLYRPVLGLPLEQRFRSAPLHYRTVHPKYKERWASPLHLKVIRLGGKYYPLAVFFPDHAMRDGEGVRLQPAGRTPAGGPRNLPVSRDLLQAMMQAVPPGGTVLLEGTG
ncbi:MAG: hypothetical protein Kow00109_22500 [Acidobacteriota bacterium]